MYLLSCTRHILDFKFNARTSRGAMQQHVVYYLKLWQHDAPEVVGLGECAPLPGLSPEHGPAFEQRLLELIRQFNEAAFASEESVFDTFLEKKLKSYPSLYFALETALQDLRQGGKRLLFRNGFSEGKSGIPINGLIWMGDREFMQEQIGKKLQEGYSCLKLKIGGLDFGAECEMLAQIREVAPPGRLTLRLDANGAFSTDEALQKLEKLAQYHIHSIEQPIRQGQRQQLRQLCRTSPIPIALDEELIGISETEAKTELLDAVQPPYIILKPTLLGGLAASREWIKLAEERQAGWWVTSALESNIGLNVISQFTAEFPIQIPQGLGTGQLYHNNIGSPLQIREGSLFYNTALHWEDIE